MVTTATKRSGVGGSASLAETTPMRPPSRPATRPPQTSPDARVLSSPPTATRTSGPRTSSAPQMVLAPAAGLADATPDAAPDDLLVEHAHEVLRAVPGGRLQPATASHGEEQWTATEAAAADATAAGLGSQLDAEEQAAAMRSSKKKKKKKNRHRGKSGGRACGGAAGSTTAAAAVKATADALPSLTEKKKTSQAKLKLGRCAPVAGKDGLKQLEEAASAFTAVGDEADEEATDLKTKTTKTKTATKTAS